MRIDIVHGLEGVISTAEAFRKQIIAAINAPHQVWNHSRVAFEKTTHVVTKSCIPLKPGRTRKSASQLTGAGIPRFREQRHSAQLWVGSDFIENWGLSPIERSVGIAAEHRC